MEFETKTVVREPNYAVNKTVVTDGDTRLTASVAMQGEDAGCIEVSIAVTRRKTMTVHVMRMDKAASKALFESLRDGMNYVASCVK